MAIHNVSQSNDMTHYGQAKFYLQNFGNEVREAFNKDMGLPVAETRPIRDGVNYLINQWAKPAAQDAVSVVKNTVTPAVSKLTDSEVFDGVKSVFDSGSRTSSGASYSAARPVVNSGSSASDEINYLYADLAKHYGMDSHAAYSEALQNTAYTRAVADLKRAGLNPVLAAGKVSPAGSYAVGNTLSYGSGSGASGGYSGGNTGKYALSSNQYNMLGVIGTAVGALVGSRTTPGSPMLGATSGAMLGKQLLQGAAQFVSSALRK